MSTPIFRRRAERFAQLLDQYGDQRTADGEKDLVSLVSVGRRMAAIRPDVEVDRDFRAELRALLVATAQREGIGATANSAAPAAVPAARAPRLRRPVFTGQRSRTRTAVILGVAAGAITVSGISAASENSVPGDALYGMKRSTERAQLALADSDADRGQLHLDFARSRLAEAQAVRGDVTSLVAVLHDLDAETREGFRLLATSAVTRKDGSHLDAVAAFVDSQRPRVAALLEGTPRAVRERGLASLALLDEVAKRAAALRSGFACGAPVSGFDGLGPVPGRCPTW